MKYSILLCVTSVIVDPFWLDFFHLALIFLHKVFTFTYSSLLSLFNSIMFCGAFFIFKTLLDCIQVERNKVGRVGVWFIPLVAC